MIDERRATNFRRAMQRRMPPGWRIEGYRRALHGKEVIGGIVALFLAAPAFAGTVTCAGKTYRDVTYATIEPVGYTEVVRLWVGEVTDATVHPHRASAAKFTIVLNTDMICEMEDVDLHVRGEDD